MLGISKTLFFEKVLKPNPGRKSSPSEHRNCRGMKSAVTARLPIAGGQ
jgi:hypothetical protein